MTSCVGSYDALFRGGVQWLETARKSLLPAKKKVQVITHLDSEKFHFYTFFGCFPVIPVFMLSYANCLLPPAANRNTETRQCCQSPHPTLTKKQINTSLHVPLMGFCLLCVTPPKDWGWRNAWSLGIKVLGYLGQSYDIMAWDTRLLSLNLLHSLADKADSSPESFPTNP